MNSSANTNEQQGDPSWASENWDGPGAVGGLDQASRQYTGANRLDWEWDPMFLAQHPGNGGFSEGPDADRKNQMTAESMSSMRGPYSMLSSGLPSNCTQNPVGMFSPANVGSFGPLDNSSQLSTSSNLQNVLGSSGIPGLAASSGSRLHNDICGYDPRRFDVYGGGIHEHQVKREEVNDGHARIGLNLGLLPYYSTEDTASDRLGKRQRSGSPSSQVPMCQAEGCKADLSAAKHYHRRHKVCEFHSKAPTVIAGGHTQRFCQQCSRFHSLGEFDEGKRSCRKRLADHNRRRRKPQPNASTCGVTSAESIGMTGGGDDGDHSPNNRGATVTADQKSMLMHLKKCGSPSSASLEDSDEKPSPGSSNLQLRTSGPGFGRGPGDDQRPSHSGIQPGSSHEPMTNTDEAQAYLSAMSLSTPPNPLILHGSKHHLTMMPGTADDSDDNNVYQQYLPGPTVESRSLRVASSNVDDFLILRQS